MAGDWTPDWNSEVHEPAAPPSTDGQSGEKHAQDVLVGYSNMTQTILFGVDNLVGLLRTTAGVYQSLYRSVTMRDAKLLFADLAVIHRRHMQEIATICPLELADQDNLDQRNDMLSDSLFQCESDAIISHVFAVAIGMERRIQRAYQSLISDDLLSSVDDLQQLCLEQYREVRQLTAEIQFERLIAVGR